MRRQRSTRTPTIPETTSTARRPRRRPAPQPAARHSASLSLASAPGPITDDAHVAACFVVLAPQLNVPNFSIHSQHRLCSLAPRNHSIPCRHRRCDASPTTSCRVLQTVGYFRIAYDRAVDVNNVAGLELGEPLALEGLGPIVGAAFCRPLQVDCRRLGRLRLTSWGAYSGDVQHEGCGCE